MAKKKGLTLALVASGSGTDAEAIMLAWRAGWIPEVGKVYLVSTKAGAGCLGKAKESRVRSFVVPWEGKERDFNKELTEKFLDLGVELVFLVGCIHKIHPGVAEAIYNIHPADPDKHGGKGMYGLKVHEYVLRDIKDRILRQRAKPTGRFFTRPTIHRVDAEYDSGDPLMTVAVRVPEDLVERLMADEPLEDLAKALQRHVLAFEHAMLPGAVRLAAMKAV